MRRDLTHYQHLHPFSGADGTWTAPLTLPESGDYRAFADFAVGGKPLTLGVDLRVPSYYEPRPLPAPTGFARAVNYEVTLNKRCRVDRRRGYASLPHNPRRARNHQPRALSRGSGAFSATAPRRSRLPARPPYRHRRECRASGSQITFHVRFSSMGRYRLFLQFVHEGQIHTATFR